LSNNTVFCHLTSAINHAALWLPCAPAHGSLLPIVTAELLANPDEVARVALRRELALLDAAFKHLMPGTVAAGSDAGNPIMALLQTAWPLMVPILLYAQGERGFGGAIIAWCLLSCLDYARR